jgi:hypothetical protein
MRLESFVITEMLQHLEQQGAALVPRFDEIAEAIDRGECATALAASAALHRALDALVATTATLQVHVVANDGLGELGESLGELAVRASGLVLVSQLGRLREALRDAAAQARARRWLAGGYQDIEQIIASVREKVMGVHALWLPHRPSRAQSAGIADPDRVSMYRTAVRMAQRALRELRRDPDLARLVDGGLSARDLSEIHMSCIQIDTALRVQIDVELGRHMLPRPSRLSASSDATGRR